MASINRNKKVNTKFLQDVADSYKKSMNTADTVDIITFAEAQWGLNIKLFPVQKFILKTFYGLEITSGEKNIIIPDELNTKEIGRFDEKGFMDFLIETGRTNLREYIPGKAARELILCCGRRASKCHSFNAPIYTTDGIMQIEELYNALLTGKKIGINTYNVTTGKVNVTYDIKMEENGIQDCYEYETATGKNDETTGNHPYLVYNNKDHAPRWIQGKHLNIGDRVACLDHSLLCGNNTMGNIVRAKITAFICAYGGVKNNTIRLFNIEREPLNNVMSSIQSQFGSCTLRAVPKFTKSYDIVDMDSSNENSLTKWINDIGLNKLESDKIYPDIVNKLNREEIVAFLETLFKSVNSFCKDSDCLSLYTSNAKAIRDIQRLFMAVGIEYIRASSKDKCITISKNAFDKINGTEQTVIYEEIRNIRHTGQKRTYAIEVGNTHVIANSIITHNSSLASIISNYEIYRLIKMGNPQEYFGFPDGQEIAVTTASTSDDNALPLFNMMKTRCLNCSYLKDRVVNKTLSYFNLKTEADDMKENEPSIFMLCGGAGSQILRGHNNIVVIFDEAAFFSLSGKNSGEDVYQALTPSVASFTKGGDKNKGEGKIILLSSPYGKSGIFHQKYMQSFDNAENTLMFEMYSTMVNPTIDSSILKDEKRKNPSSFSREYGGKFSDTVSSWIDQDTLEKVLNKSIVQNPRKGERGIEYYMGLDYGGKNDGASIAIVHKEDEKIILDYADVYYSGSSDVYMENHHPIYNNVNKLFAGHEIIPINGFIDEVKRLCDMFPTVYGWFDQFNGYALMEALKNKNLTQFEARSVSASLNTQVYQVCKTLINSQMIEIFDHNILVPEFLFLEEIIDGNQLRVEAPQRTGFHDDISDSFARAVFGCYEKSRNKPNKQGLRSFSNNSNHGIAIGKTYSAYHVMKRKMHGDRRSGGLTL